MSNRNLPLSTELDKNLQILKSIYKGCIDVIYHPFLIAGKTNLVYIDGLSDTEQIDSSVLAPLMSKTIDKSINLQETCENIQLSNIRVVKTYDDCIKNISNGNPLGLAKWDKRSIKEPDSESVIRGPREGFVETLGVNISMLRRKIRSPNLKMIKMNIGSYSDTSIIIAYIEGIANQSLIDEVQNRLQKVEIDSVLESGYIEELIEDNVFSPFPQLLDTERPDVASANLLEGRVVILVDGTPFVLIAPVSFFSFFQAPDDYYQRYLISSVIRIMRLFFMLISVFLPSLYVAVSSFHQEMVPTTLILSMASLRESVPFTALIEAVIMEIVFEALREAGLRLPKQVGAAVSIVGALVIGQAAVQAGLVSPLMVIVVAITGIASFMIPRYSEGVALRLIRFPIMMLAGTMGLYGLALGFIAIVIHLCKLRSFGVPYLSPIAPTIGRDMKDAFIRSPWWMLNTRQHLTGRINKYRQAPNQQPKPKNR
ncbi:spore germination protein [Neobacillus sp. 114]|uniref:spore germination protein n=1 Tax=Neobacillus sp. 114 TaxID=3048535 RepID=UPI0024C33AC6|nr:spore germination protein [Neobacillus sp. 114]